jgi:hypothetical protein
MEGNVVGIGISELVLRLFLATLIARCLGSIANSRGTLPVSARMGWFH